MTEQTEKCKWHQSDFESDYWDSECGISFELNDGTPSENQMHFCCKCGKPVEEIPWTDDDEEDEE